MGAWRTYELEDDAASARGDCMPSGSEDIGWMNLVRALALL
jgi:hypothetical protein